MSGLLQRLAGQATVANTGGTPIRGGRIRPAASVHAPAPVALSADAEIEQLPQAYSHAPREANLAEERSAAWEAHPPVAMPAHAAQTSAFAKSPIASVPHVSTTQLEESSPTRKDRTPQALLGEPPTAESPASAITPITPPPMAINMAPQPAANESTEIHLHIGRIEVSALQESATLKGPRASARRATQSLDEYLAGRRS
jgi:hypothetical protein